MRNFVKKMIPLLFSQNWTVQIKIWIVNKEKDKDK